MTETPKRIQRKRTKGWKMPEGAVYVGRPTVFGNPFEVFKTDCCGFWDVRDENDVTYLVDHNVTHRDGCAPHWAKSYATREAVRLYSDHLTYWFGGLMKHDAPFREAVESLRGHDLACWCPLDQPCHADVLLELANPTHPVEQSERDA